MTVLTGGVEQDEPDLEELTEFVMVKVFEMDEDESHEALRTLRELAQTGVGVLVTVAHDEVTGWPSFSRW